MKNLNPDVEAWFTPKREALMEALTLSGMRSDAIFAVLNGLKTEAQQTAMGQAWLEHYDRTGKYLTPEEVMLGMVSIRRTGKFSPTGKRTTRKTRRSAD